MHLDTCTRGLANLGGRCGGADGQRRHGIPRLRFLPSKLIDQQNRAVPAEEVDQYLDALEEPKRTTLARLRQTILDILPEADQGISYGVPGLQGPGKDNRRVRRV